MLIRCPSCQTEYTLELSSAGALCTCFRCNHEFYVDVHGVVGEVPSRANKTPDIEEPQPISEAEEAKEKVSLNEKIKSIDAKYKSFEDDLSLNGDDLFTIDDLGDDDIPDVEVPSSTPSLAEQLKDVSPPAITPSPHKSLVEEPIVPESPNATTQEKQKNRFLAWKNAKKGNKKNIEAAPEVITETKKKWSLPWGKKAKKKSKQTPTVKPVAPIIAPPTKKKHRIWPWIALILLLLMAAGLWFKKDVWLHNPSVRSTLLKVGLSKTASDADWFIDHQSIRMRWQKNNEGKEVLIIEGNINNTLAIPLPLPQFKADFGNPKTTPVLLHSTLPMYLNNAVNHHGKENLAWQDTIAVAADGTRLFILVLRDVSLDGVQRVRVSAIAGENTP